MENYEDAAESRFTDWELLSKGENRRKAGTIHFGGIYIECLLKGIICSEHSVVEGSSPYKWIIDGQEASRPGHALTASAYRDYLSDLYDDMPDDVSDALEYISCPETSSYIDYRYVSEDSVSDIVYNKWMENFISVFEYLEQKKHEA